MAVPWMGSLTLASSATAYQLSALLAALPSGQKPTGRGVVAQFITIQLDDSAGSANLYLGNSAMTISPPFYGSKIVAGQAYPIFSMDANLIVMGDLYLQSDTNGVQINVAFITR